MHKYLIAYMTPTGRFGTLVIDREDEISKTNLTEVTATVRHESKLPTADVMAFSEFAAD
jgi:hypothetical protein